MDQIDRAYHALLHNAPTRQVVLQIWDARSDTPSSDGQPVNSDVPCNLMSMLKIRDNKLEWTQILRSNDLFLGVPYNFVQFTFLQEIMAGWLGVEVGSYNHFSDSLHAYVSDFDKYDMTPESASAENTDEFVFSRKDTEKFFCDLESVCERLAGASNARAIKDCVEHVDLPTSFSNWLYILGAETARRHGFHDDATQMICKCSNPLLVYLWCHWANRFGGWKYCEKA